MPWVKNVSPEVDAISQYPTILGVCISLTAFMVLVVVLRIWTRAALVKAMGTDDIVVMCTSVSLTVCNERPQGSRADFDR